MKVSKHAPELLFPEILLASGPWYQPELYYKIFMRAMFNKDIATGFIPVFDHLTTIGPSSTFHVKNKIPERPVPKCYVLDTRTCTPEQYATVLNGTAVVKDFMVVGTEQDMASQDLNRVSKQDFLRVEGQVEL